MIEPHGNGGISHYTYELSNALQQNGVDVTVFTSERYELGNQPRLFSYAAIGSSQIKRWLVAAFRGSNPNVETESAVNETAKTTEAQSDPDKTTRTRNRRAWTSIKRTLLQIEVFLWIAFSRISVIHLQWPWPDDRPNLFLSLCRSAGKKTVYTAHNLLPHDDGRVETRIRMETFYSLFDRLIVHSADNFRECCSLFSIKPETIVTIPHGNYGFFLEEREPSTEDYRANYGFSRSDFVLLFFGSIRKYKGLDVLLESFEIAHLTQRNLRLLIVGELEPYDGKDRAYFESWITDRNLLSEVVFQEGYVPMSEVANVFDACDVVVLPYLKTYQSGVVHLAYSSKKPVIATKTGGLQDVVQNGVSGVLVEPGDSRLLAEAVVEFSKETRQAAEMGRRAYELSLTDFSWSSIAKSTRVVYESLLAN